MRKYTASMLSEGNHLFQASITILDNGVKLRIPNFWRDQETFFSFSDISGVELTTPSWYAVLTYSTINFNLRGTWVEAHGFTKSDAITIKKLIDSGRNSGGNSTYNEFGEDTSKFSGYKQQQWINYQHDRQVKLDREEKIAKKNEQNRELIPKLKIIIKDYWVEILSYDNNNDFNKLSDMVSPQSNPNAIEELNDYIKKLKQILFDLYDDYWEIEYKSINDEIWNDINCELKSFFDDRYIEKYNESRKLIINIIKVWGKMNFNLLRDESVDYPKITNLFIDVIYKTKKRKSLINKMKVKIVEEKEWEDNYRPELLTLLMVIDRIFDNLRYFEGDINGIQRVFYHLDFPDTKSYITSSTISTSKKLAFIIEITNNFISEIIENKDKW